MDNVSTLPEEESWVEQVTKIVSSYRETGPAFKRYGLHQRPDPNDPNYWNIVEEQKKYYSDDSVDDTDFDRYDEERSTWTSRPPTRYDRPYKFNSNSKQYIILLLQKILYKLDDLTDRVDALSH